MQCRPRRAPRHHAQTSTGLAHAAALACSSGALCLKSPAGTSQVKRKSGVTEGVHHPKRTTARPCFTGAARHSVAWCRRSGLLLWWRPAWGDDGLHRIHVHQQHGVQRKTRSQQRVQGRSPAFKSCILRVQHAAPALELEALLGKEDPVCAAGAERARPEGRGSRVNSVVIDDAASRRLAVAWPLRGARSSGASAACAASGD